MITRLACLAALVALVLAPGAGAAPTHDLGGEVLGAQIERDLAPSNCEGLRSIGSRATALFVTRGSLTRADGSFDFGGIDADVNAELACGIEPGLRVSTKTATDPDAYPPDPAAYADLLTALAGHLDGRVTRYAIDNETATQGHFPDTPENYYAPVRLSDDAIHAGDPDALVVDASMAYGSLGVVEANHLFAEGRADDAVALMREVQANELGGGPAARRPGSRR